MPKKVTENVSLESLEDVIEIVLDIGRRPEMRKSDGSIVPLGVDTVTSEDILYVTGFLQEFTRDNRSGIP